MSLNNANQMSYTSQSTKMLISRNKITSIDGDMEKLKHLYITCGNAKWYTIVEDNLTAFQKAKHDQAVLLLDIYPKELK